MGGSSPDTAPASLVRLALAHAGDAILVGGQAVAYWADYYRVGFIGTRDIDFLGDAQAAKFLADQLRGETRIPDWEDHTPNTAIVMIPAEKRGGKPVEIDYLGSIIGLDEKQIAKRALQVRYGNASLRVMHPLDCLDSRIANLSLLPGKQNETGVAQAHTAIAIARHYLLDKSSDRRYLLNLAERLYDMALSHNGKRVYARWGMDTLKAIPLEAMPEQFVHQRWPRMQTEITDKRERYRRPYQQGASSDSDDPGPAP